MTTTDSTPDEPCSCSEHNAQETHELIAAIGEARGIDLCDPDAEHDTDEDHDLQVIHDFVVAQGAHCGGLDDDDDDDPDDLDIHDLDGSSDEHPAFSDDDGRSDAYDSPDVTDDGVAVFRDWTAEERDALPPEDFAGPQKTFPIADQADVDAAARLLGRAKNPDAVRSKIVAIARRKGLAIPDAWKG
jgi:hypothetical protein